MGVGCTATWVAIQARGLEGQTQVAKTGGKEPELVREVERYQLDLVGLTSRHSRGSESVLLDREWALFFSGVDQCEATGRGYSSSRLPLYWSLPWWTRGSPPYAYRLRGGENSDRKSVV